MKRLILSSLIGLMTTGAMADRAEVAEGLKNCLNNYLNNTDIVNFLNDGPETQTDETPFKGLQDMITGANNKDGQIYSISNTFSDSRSIDPVVRENRSNLAKASVGSMLLYVSNFCPEYFVAFAQSIGESNFTNYENMKATLQLPIIWDDTAQKIKVVTMDTYTETPKENQVPIKIDINKILSNLASTYYLLALPKGTGTPGKWLVYNDADKAITNYNGSCKNKMNWSIPYKNSTNYIINGKHQISRYNSFPGQLINYDKNHVSAVGQDTNGMTVINHNQCSDCVTSNALLDFAVKDGYKIANDFYTANGTDGCNPKDFRLYIASTNDPIAIVAKYLNTAELEIENPKTFGEVASTTLQWAKWPAILSGIAYGTSAASYGLAYSTATMAGTTVTAAAELGATATGAAKATNALSKASRFARGAGTGFLVLTGITAILTVTYEALFDDTTPVTVEGYDQLFIMHEISPSDISSADQEALTNLNSNVLQISDGFSNTDGNGYTDRDDYSTPEQKNQAEQAWEKKKKQASQIRDW
ncbi:MAG: hypothetical protein J6R22_04455 [Alphaproteobacteria bacterium]|nr:hypothetical protein [Alphaproteobacteria bacterium]